MRSWLIGAGIVLGCLVLGLAVGFGIWALIQVDSGPSLKEQQVRANAACGQDRTRDVEYHPSGFARRESFETHCVRADGTIYVVVTMR